MVRNCAVIALFIARLIVAIFDLGSPQPLVAALKSDEVSNPRPAIVAEAPPTTISGLPEDAGTLRR